MTRPISWDADKRRQILRERRIDLLRVALILERRVDLTIALDTRAQYGEYRYQAVGRLDDQYYFLVYAKRNGARHLITAWRLSDASRQRYQDRLARRD
jgi:uncharacterized DUF497 family protein